jgi:hypothetical protein
MPRGNGTGPMGMGAQTGRGMGFCSGVNMPGQGQGFGSGRGRGGRGYRNCFNATGLPGWARSFMYDDEIKLSPEKEKAMLVSQSEELKQQLEFVTKRLGEIESNK